MYSTMSLEKRSMWNSSSLKCCQSSSRHCSEERKNTPFILYLLHFSDLAEGVPPRVNQFFQLVIEFAIRTFTTIDSPDLVECVCRIFTPDAQFFSKYSEDVEVHLLYLSISRLHLVKGHGFV
jgi:hypothetical protein